MDGQIRLRGSEAFASMPSTPNRPTRETLTLPGADTKANAFALRRAILDCAAGATKAEPANTEMRMYSFLAQLSARMECLGEKELDAALWNLMETESAQAKEG